MLSSKVRKYTNNINRDNLERIRGMAKNLPNNTLTFDSFFEEGNLDYAIKVKESEYDLFIRTDSNARGHHQWFYYSVQNKDPGTWKFNILNFTKRDSLYSQGMRVAVFSEAKAKKAKEGDLPNLFKKWHRGGENITYQISKLTQELYKKAQIM